MAGKLDGKKVIALMANEGVEQVELDEPLKAMKAEGAEVHLAAPDKGTIQAFNHLDKADIYDVDVAVSDVKASDYDALFMPGGVANPDHLRQDEEAVQLVRGMYGSGKPIAAICHAPWVLVEAGVVDGRTLTSYPSLKTDIRNAGGTWEDTEVCVDRGLTTSRGPRDLPAFCSKLVEEFCEGKHER